MHLYLFPPIGWQIFETFCLKKNLFSLPKSVVKYAQTSRWFGVANLTTFEKTKVKKTFVVGQQVAPKTYEFVMEWTNF